MLEKVKRWLKAHEPFRTISWIREQGPRKRDLTQFRRCGANVRIASDATLSHPHMISVGENVVIHPNVMINGGGGLVIGNNVGISYRTTIWTIDHTYHDGKKLPFDDNGVLRPVLINDNVAIGANAVIMPGVEIGEGAIIGMGAVVTSDVKPLSVVFGNPARPIGFRDRDDYERCKAEGRFYDFTRKRVDPDRERIVPLFIQQRPRLYEIVRAEVEEGRAVLEQSEHGNGSSAKTTEPASASGASS